MLVDHLVANDENNTSDAVNEGDDNSDDSISEEDDVVLVQDVEADEADLVIEQVQTADWCINKPTIYSKIYSEIPMAAYWTQRVALWLGYIKD